jgi:alkanesulfonate monooxygenase SsuD/methylene tetrahydromethanopterin reductase-like flavin-dependent oxidoreductase (luciferase family)
VATTVTDRIRLGTSVRVTGQERIEPASLTVRPAQHPRPPILLAAYTAAGLDRIARSADGWLPTSLAVRRHRRRMDHHP